jgi:multidrug resistance efflux pump
MFLALLITVFFGFFVWLVFFRFKWLQWSIAWGVVSAFVFVHVLLIFLIGVRFSAPFSTDARVVQHTIQLIPRLPEPTLVTAVLVQPNTPVKKGQPLFQFDRRPYQYQVNAAEAGLATATQNPAILGSDVAASVQAVIRAKSALSYARSQEEAMRGLVQSGSVSTEEEQKWIDQASAGEAAVQQAVAALERSRARNGSKVDGVYAAIAAAQAQLDQARYYLENTTLVAPEDGVIVNLQVRPGMVAGIIRAGAIASLVCDDDRFLLATYDQEVLLYVAPGQPVEIALDRFPGRIFKGTVSAIWPSGAGQLLPSGTLPSFKPEAPDTPQGMFAARISFDDPDAAKFAMGTQGAAAIYAGTSAGFRALRRIGIRAHSWLNWLYPLPF